jgi:hypothetical protein
LRSNSCEGGAGLNGADAAPRAASHAWVKGNLWSQLIAVEQMQAHSFERNREQIDCATVDMPQ